MQVPYEITFDGMDPSDAVRARVEKEINRLERFHDRITSCRVAITAPGKHKRQGGLFDVRIFMAIPGGAEVAAQRNPGKDHAHEDVYVAIRDAFAAARRQLQDKDRKIENNVKLHAAPPHGRIARIFYYEGYGFIETPDGSEVYFHRNSVTGTKFDRLEVGHEVRFTEEPGEKGPQASVVQLTGNHHTA
ncbi:MAG: HPF/RaiA family ribosome-associated protein [Pseudomonadota bacterium]